jgi:hypothetical protein
MLSPRMWQHK